MNVRGELQQEAPGFAVSSYSCQILCPLSFGRNLKGFINGYKTMKRSSFSGKMYYLFAVAQVSQKTDSSLTGKARNSHLVELSLIGEDALTFVSKTGKRLLCYAEE